MDGMNPKRMVAVQISLNVPEALLYSLKQLTLSFHSQEIAGYSRAVETAWTDVVRMAGVENTFSVSMAVPADLPLLLYAIALIDEPGEENHNPVIRRHIGFANFYLPGTSDDVTMAISSFDKYTLVMPSDSSGLRAA